MRRRKGGNFRVEGETGLLGLRLFNSKKYKYLEPLIESVTLRRTPAGRGRIVSLSEVKDLNGFTFLGAAVKAPLDSPDNVRGFEIAVGRALKAMSEVYSRGEVYEHIVKEMKKVSVPLIDTSELERGCR